MWVTFYVISVFLWICKTSPWMLLGWNWKFRLVDHCMSTELACLSKREPILTKQGHQVAGYTQKFMWVFEIFHIIYYIIITLYYNRNKKNIQIMHFVIKWYFHVLRHIDCSSILFGDLYFCLQLWKK